MGKTSFSRAELAAIKSLLKEIRRADPPRQKVLRARLRRMFDFYISDFAADQQGFVATDVDALVRYGVITVTTTTATSTKERSPTSAGRALPARARAAHAYSRAASTPRSFTRADLEAAGFIGWRTWAELRANKLAELPLHPGAYLVHRPALDDPVFDDTSLAGHFKRRDPTVPIEVLADNWVAHAHALYIGKANALRARLRQYARFGAGERVGHWGGRYIWQLADVGELVVAWRAIASGDTREYERQLLERFAALYDGRRPFANLTG